MTSSEEKAVKAEVSSMKQAYAKKREGEGYLLLELVDIAERDAEDALESGDTRHGYLLADVAFFLNRENNSRFRASQRRGGELLQKFEDSDDGKNALESAYENTTDSLQFSSLTESELENSCEFAERLADSIELSLEMMEQSEPSGPGMG